jgi:hypothetical protein
MAMKKKFYSKPEVSKTKIDYSITLTQSSQDEIDPNGPAGIPPPPGDFVNPMKWFK